MDMTWLEQSVMAILGSSVLHIAAQQRYVVARPKTKSVTSEHGTWSRVLLYVHASFRASRVGFLQVANDVPTQCASRQQCVQRKVGKWDIDDPRLEEIKEQRSPVAKPSTWRAVFLACPCLEWK